MLWLQASAIDKEDTRRVAENIRSYTQHLLQEAWQAARTSARIPYTDCEETERNQLSNIIAASPHLHSITRIVNGYSECSTLTGQRSRNLSHIIFTGNMLSLQTWQAPGSVNKYPLLILTMPYSNNMRTDVGINGLFLQNHLRLTFPGRQLLIRVGNKTLGTQGVVVNNATPLMADSAELPDSDFPFSIIYSTASGLTVGGFIHDWPLPLAGSLLLSLIAGAVCYRQLYRHASPRKNLLRALRKGELHTVYQPIVSSADGSIMGFETLCRWHHPVEGTIPPDVFIPMAEQTGLIVLLTQYQLEQIAKDMAVIAPLLGRPFYVSVNFSRQHCMSGAFLHDCDHLIKLLYPLGCRLVVEITEREQLDMTPEMARRFAWLRSAGVAVALDDFGTGYSNLSWITSLTPDYLKIDKLFVSHMQPGHTVLLDCVIELAVKLGIHTIAEGVETSEQAEYLKEKGVSFQQGYYWYRPLEKGVLATKLSKATGFH